MPNRTHPQFEPEPEPERIPESLRVVDVRPLNRTIAYRIAFAFDWLIAGAFPQRRYPGAINQTIHPDHALRRAQRAARDSALRDPAPD